MAYADGPQGIGGWLAFFLVTLGVITPGASLIGTLTMVSNSQLVAVYGPVWPMLVGAEWALAALIAILCWFATARFLFFRVPSSITIGVVVLWLVVLIDVVLEPLAVALIAGVGVDRMIGAIIGPELFRPFIYATIWTLYLKQSVRVANTYHPEEERADELSEVFE